MTAGFLGNEMVISIFIAWFLSQVVLKILIASYKRGKLVLRAGTLGGGMPSSHSSLVAALATAIGLSQGFSSPIFLVALVLALLTVYQVLLEKRIIARFFEEIAKDHPKKHILEELGHNMTEVLAGVAIGIVVVLLFYYY
jgi:acid phosphatase family membrane protein YuiD